MKFRSKRAKNKSFTEKLDKRQRRKISRKRKVPIIKRLPPKKAIKTFPKSKTTFQIWNEAFDKKKTDDVIHTGTKRGEISESEATRLTEQMVAAKLRGDWIRGSEKPLEDRNMMMQLILDNQAKIVQHRVRAYIKISEAGGKAIGEIQIIGTLPKDYSTIYNIFIGKTVFGESHWFKAYVRQAEQEARSMGAKNVLANWLGGVNKDGKTQSIIDVAFDFA